MEQQPVVEKLLKSMSVSPGFAGLTASAKTISRLSDRDDGDEMREIVAAILRDAVLTGELLRLANASSRGSHHAFTVDQAIALLGLNKIKSVALSLPPFTSASNQLQLNQLHAELVASWFCGLLCAVVTRHNASRFSAQEAQVCGLLQNLGRIMATYYLYEDTERCRVLQIEKNLAEDEAATEVFGMKFIEIGASIAAHWNVPDILQQSFAAETGAIPPVAVSNAQGWHLMCTLFSRRVTDVLFRSHDFVEQVRIVENIDFFHTALFLKEEETREWINKSLREIDTLLEENNFSCNVEQARALLRKVSKPEISAPAESTPEVGAVANDIKTENKKPTEIIQQALQCIHDELAFDITLLCLPSGASGLIAITGAGKAANSAISQFRCHGEKPDIFRLVMAKKLDLYVADVKSPAYAKYIPDWHQQAVGTQSFLVQSLVYDGQFLGLLYGGYVTLHPAAPVQLSQARVQQWRNQLMLALKTIPQKRSN